MSCHQYLSTLLLFPFTGRLHEPAFHKHIFLHLSSTILLHTDTTPSLSTLLSPSPPAFSSCYLSKSVLHFQIGQMFSIQQYSRSGAVGCRTLKLLISHLAWVANLRAFAMNDVGASCKSFFLIFRNQIKNQQRPYLYVTLN